MIAFASVPQPSAMPGSRPFRVLLVDADPGVRRAASAALREGYRVTTASNLDKALRKLAGPTYDLVLFGLGLDLDPEAARALAGLARLAALKKSFPLLPVVALVPLENPDLFSEAIRLGAQSCIPKPFIPEQLRRALHELTASLAFRHLNEAAELEANATAPCLATGEPEMRRMLDLAARAAQAPCTMLLLGESGTGKNVLARTIHSLSPWREKPFVTVSCPCLSQELLESELFGHAEGAFTGACGETWGKVAAAEGGTLFLDEVGDLPPALQPKLLRLLQDREYERVGEALPRPANVRIVAATNHNLDEAVRDGSFREDLYYRLNVVTLTLPPLRRRPVDLLRHAEHFLRLFAAEIGKPIRGWTAEAGALLQQHVWPGNLRELRNVIERAAILCDGAWIEPRHLPDFLQSVPPPPRVGALVSLERIELEHIRHVIARSRSYEQAAEILGIDPNTLHRKRKKLEQEERASLREALVD